MQYVCRNCANFGTLHLSSSSISVRWPKSVKNFTSGCMTAPVGAWWWKKVRLSDREINTRREIAGQAIIDTQDRHYVEALRRPAWRKVKWEGSFAAKPKVSQPVAKPQPAINHSAIGSRVSWHKCESSLETLMSYNWISLWTCFWLRDRLLFQKCNYVWVVFGQRRKLSNREYCM